MICSSPEHSFLPRYITALSTNSIKIFSQRAPLSAAVVANSKLSILLQCRIATGANTLRHEDQNLPLEYADTVKLTVIVKAVKKSANPGHAHEGTHGLKTEQK